MNDLIIIGASGLGREVLWLTERINRINPTWNVLGFLDDNADIIGKTVNGAKVLGSVSDAELYKDACFICAVGAAKIRKNIIKRLESQLPNVKYALLQDPSAVVSESAEVGAGSIICALSVVTVNVKIGSHVIINPSCTVGHDTEINDFTILYPAANVAGNTIIGKVCELGTGSQVIQGRVVGNNTIVGAGAVVITDLPADCIAVGVPARVIKYHAFESEEEQ